jgi:hypothetical protein
LPISKHRRPKGIGLALMLPLILALLLPVGLMPAQAPDGGVAMVLCSGDGPMLMQLDPQSGRLRKAPASPKHSGCDWAMAQHASAPTEPFTLPIPIPLMQQAEPVLLPQLWRPIHDPLYLWARGPPALI